MPERKIEKEIKETFPMVAKYFKAHKFERSKIERCFGKLLTHWNILNKVFKGRGNRYKHLGNIILVTAQLENLMYSYEKKLDKESKSTFVDKTPLTFAEILKRC